LEGVLKGIVQVKCMFFLRINVFIKKQYTMSELWNVVLEYSRCASLLTLSGVRLKCLVIHKAIKSICSLAFILIYPHIGPMIIRRKYIKIWQKIARVLAICVQLQGGGSFLTSSSALRPPCSKTIPPNSDFPHPKFFPWHPYERWLRFIQAYLVPVHNATTILDPYTRGWNGKAGE